MNYLILNLMKERKKTYLLLLTESITTGGKDYLCLQEACPTRL